MSHSTSQYQISARDTYNFPAVRMFAVRSTIEVVRMKMIAQSA